MKVLVTGISGQLGYCLSKTIPKGIEMIGVTHKEMDLSDADSIKRAWLAVSPDAVINAAAYTAVDKAEAEKEQAYTVNSEGVDVLAALAAQAGIPLIHISTDFVFDGRKSSPLGPEDKVAPLNVYGASKLEGEKAVLRHSQHYIVRTGWVYAEHGENFVKTMLRLGGDRSELRVVVDQIGTPTYALNLAEMIWILLSQRPSIQIFHFSDAGVASWYDFAEAIFAEAEALSLIDKKPLLKPITTDEYPTPAKRPSFSVLDKSLTWSTLPVVPIHWRHALQTMLKRLKAVSDSSI